MIKYVTITLICQIVIHSFQSCQPFFCWDSCQAFQPANEESTGCRRGRRQGRSLRIFAPTPQGSRACQRLPPLFFHSVSSGSGRSQAPKIPKTSQIWKMRVQNVFRELLSSILCRKAFQVLPRNMQTLENHDFTEVKPLFSESSLSCTIEILGIPFGPLCHPSHSHGLPNDAQGPKKGDFKEQQKN